MFVFRVQQTAMVCEHTMEQQLFLVQRKLAGATLAVIQQEYAYWWPVNTWHVVNAPAPNTKHALKKLVARFNAHGTLQDRRLHTTRLTLFT